MSIANVSFASRAVHELDREIHLTYDRQGKTGLSILKYAHESFLRLGQTFSLQQNGLNPTALQNGGNCGDKFNLTELLARTDPGTARPSYTGERSASILQSKHCSIT